MFAQHVQPEHFLPAEIKSGESARKKHVYNYKEDSELLRIVLRRWATKAEKGETCSKGNKCVLNKMGDNIDARVTTAADSFSAFYHKFGGKCMKDEKTDEYLKFEQLLQAWLDWANKVYTNNSAAVGRKALGTNCKRVLD